MTPAVTQTVKWYPLTAAQRGLWFAHELDPTSPAYTTAEVVEFDDGLDVERWQAALRTTYDQAEFLRVRVRNGPDGPEQRVEPNIGPNIGPSTSTTLDVVDVDSPTQAQAWLDARIAIPLDPASGQVTDTAVLRLPGGVMWWFHAAHHVVLDHVGFQIFARQVATHYEGRPARPLATVAEVVAETLPDDEQWWLDRLSDGTPAPTLAAATAPVAPRAVRVELPLPDALQSAIREAADVHGVPWTTWLTAAVAAHTARLTDSAQVRLGIPAMNRHAGRPLAVARTVATAVNVLPATVDTSFSWGAAVKATAIELAEVAAHPWTPQEVLARRTGLEPLFGPQVNLLPFATTVAGGRVRNLTAGPVPDLTWCVRGRPGHGEPVHLQLDANPNLYPVDDCHWHAKRMLAWLDTCARASADALVTDLPLLPADERELVERTFNATTRDVPEGTLRSAFLAQVERTPEAIAVQHGDRAWTYRHLYRRACGVAASLGPRPGRVGVQIERSPELFAAVHGIALAGGSYVPFDPDLPEGRLTTLAEEARPSSILTHDLVQALPDADEPPDVQVRPDDEAYVLFTSGSTGRPKGVQVSHRAIHHRLSWMQHAFGIDTSDVVLHKTPISFDVSVWELFWPSQTGARVLVADPGAHRDPRALAELMAEGGVTVLHFVPSMLRAFLADRTAVARASTGRLRHLVCSGEALTADLVEGSRAAWGVAPVNLYGPTEAAIDVTCFDTRDLTGEVVPIGRPIWNTRTYVLDPAGQPVPIGVAGELHLAGVQLADGYLDRPDLTAAAFVRDPFQPGERMYRAGDLAAWTAEGRLRYLGRIDSQVKIRGQRIEPGEVEAVLAPLVDEVAVVARPGRSGEQELVAFVVAGTDDESRWRSTCADTLPAAMRPARYHRLDAIPVSTSGKTDVKLLASMPLPEPERSDDALPVGLVEQEVCAQFTAALGGQVTPSEDFFTNGGSSLSAVRVVTALSEHFGVDLRLRDLFTNPSATALAQRVRALRAGSSAADTDLGEVLVLRQGAAGVPPVVALPPAAALGWSYTALLGQLPPEQGLIAIQGAGLDGTNPTLPTDLLAWAEHVWSLLDHDEVHLLGWSVGGMLAQAMAALQPQRTATLTLLDSYPVDQWQDLPVPTESEALRAVLRIAGLESLAPATVDRRTAIDLLTTHGSALASLPKTAIDASITWVITSARLVRQSPQKVAPHRAVLWQATAPRDEDWLDPAGWAQWLTGGVDVLPLDATHGELLSPPQVERIGKRLAADTDPWRQRRH